MSNKKLCSYNTNPVIKRIAIKASCEFSSPALIGSGQSDNTDSDVLRDKNGNAFLPGTSIAGVLKSHLPRASLLFGENIISPLWVYDAELTCAGNNDAAGIIELDGVAIDKENKVAIDGAKYDFEAVQTGTNFELRFLLTIRKNDDAERLEKSLRELVGALKSGYVAFGAKTRRGFGAVTCEKVVERVFDFDDGGMNKKSLDEWINFDWHDKPESWIDAKCIKYHTEKSTITAELKLDGSIMIRDIRNIYDGTADSKDVPDYKHISVNNEPVILGTSWAGAFQSGLYRLLKPKYAEKADAYFKDVFGYVQEAEDDGPAEAIPSKICFGASTLNADNIQVEGYRRITRVKIDRFTGGAASGALFTEMPWYGGTATLRIRFPKDREDVRELVLLGLDALDKGLIQIGGEASIGRGFFRVQKVIDYDGEVYDVENEIVKLFAKPRLCLKTKMESISAKEAGV